MTPLLNFVAIADAHTQGGNLKHLPRLVAAIAALPEPPDFVVSLGDSVYGRPEQDTPADLRAYHAQILRLPCPHCYVIGNHEIEPVELFGHLSWGELLEIWELPGRWYSFTCHGVRGLVLDTWVGLAEPPYRHLLDEQLAWLESELDQGDEPVVVFSHEALGFVQSDLDEWVQTDNRWFWPEPRPFEALFERHADRLLGVFEGHKHKCTWLQRGGVTYHLIAPAYQHEGQFAQVFIATDGQWRVQAHPDLGPADDHSRQVAYASKPA
jgi:hypothetical protein